MSSSHCVPCLTCPFLTPNTRENVLFATVEHTVVMQYSSQDMICRPMVDQSDVRGTGGFRRLLQCDKRFDGWISPNVEANDFFVGKDDFTAVQ